VPAAWLRWQLGEVQAGLEVVEPGQDHRRMLAPILGKVKRESSFSHLDRPLAARTLFFSSWYSQPGKLPMFLISVARLSTTLTGSQYNTLLYFLEAVMLQSSNRASTMENHTSSFSILKSRRRASPADMAFAAAISAAFMAAMLKTGASGVRAGVFPSLLAITNHYSLLKRKH
jgi:hypothetical protein